MIHSGLATSQPTPGGWHDALPLRVCSGPGTHLISSRRIDRAFSGSLSGCSVILASRIHCWIKRSRSSKDSEQVLSSCQPRDLLPMRIDDSDRDRLGNGLDLLLG